MAGKRMLRLTWVDADGNQTRSEVFDVPGAIAALLEDSLYTVDFPAKRWYGHTLNHLTHAAVKRYGGAQASGRWFGKEGYRVIIRDAASDAGLFGD